MTVQTVKLSGKEFVIVPKKDFRRLQAQAEQISAQDRGDVAEVRRRKALGPSQPYAKLRQKLGLA